MAVAVAASPDGGESSRQLGAKRSQLERELLRDVLEPLAAAVAVGCYVLGPGAAEGGGGVVGLTDRGARKIRDEITLQLHMKLNGLFSEDEITEIDKEAMDARIVGYLMGQGEGLRQHLGVEMDAMARLVCPPAPAPTALALTSTTTTAVPGVP